MRGRRHSGSLEVSLRVSGPSDDEQQQQAAADFGPWWLWPDEGAAVPLELYKDRRGVSSNLPEANEANEHEPGPGQCSS